MQVLGDDGARVDVRIDGVDGDCVVLIHGFPLSREIWNAQSDALSKTYRVIRLDLRGMGLSSVADGPYLMETLASDVAATLDALGVSRAAIVGHSLGGYVALAFARMFCERVTHLGLVCGRLAADAPETAAARCELADRIERENSIEPVIDAYLPRLFAPETFARSPELVSFVRDIASHNDPRGAAAMLRGMASRCDAYDIAGDLDIPALEIAGACDSVLSMDEARAVARALPKARLVECAVSGHLPMLEEPEAVSAALAALLSEPPGAVSA